MEKKKINLLEPKWWNPLFWLVVILAPIVGVMAGMVSGALCGLLIGYEKGLDVASRKLSKFIAKLP